MTSAFIAISKLKGSNMTEKQLKLFILFITRSLEKILA